MSADGLNLAQQDAVNHLRGPCLVLAGAGSGKTRVITHKIARLMQTGVPASRIAAITFTNKAAAEMRERARQLAGKEAGQVIICTFHALGVRLLREDGAALGLKPGFSILDSDDALSLLKDCGKTTDSATARQWQWAISRWKNAGLSPEEAAAQAQGEIERQTAQIMARYHERLAAYQSVDFDDLIGLPLRLLLTQPEVAQKWQARLAHTLVDEYQDTNATQYQLMKALVGQAANFTAVGDDDQSIYGWRGATLDNLRQLPRDFPQLKVIKLEQNYRSTGAILRAANNVIGPNPKLFPKRLYSSLGEGEPVRVLACDHEQHEAERAVARIQSLRATAPQRSWRDFAVLYRANHQAKAFEQALRRAFLTAPKSRTCAPGCACGSTKTTTRPSCAPPPRRAGALATRRWPRWANSPAARACRCLARFFPTRCPPPCPRAPWPRCMNLAASSAASRSRPATPWATAPRASC